MCGIIAVLRRHSRRQPPSPHALTALLTEAEQQLVADADAAQLAAAASTLEQLDRELRGVPGLMALLDEAALGGAIATRAEALRATLLQVEAALDAATAATGEGTDTEARNQAI
ncbi:MAG: hypothetical protein KDC48_22920, partial [Planctomycetes bacterium]|nr:hypothetical protein [Planctomycetota bacterium]